MRAMTLRRFELPAYAPYVLLLVLLLVLALAIALVAGSPRRVPAPFGLAATGEFVYDAGGELYLADVRTGEVTPLVTTPNQAEFGAVWSRDGTLVAYAAQAAGEAYASLWVVSADGSGARRINGDLPLVPLDVMPVASWSPDSSRLAFATAGRLYIVDVDGTGLRQIAEDVTEIVSPSWSPTGDLIAFSGAGGAYVSSPDGGASTKLSSRAGGVIEHVPSWSPDGERIAYHAGANADVFVATRDGSGWHESVVVGGPTFDSWPAFSSDGNRLSFLRSAVSDHGHIVVADVLGQNPRILAPNTIVGWAPHCWLPDDRGILAVAAEENVPIGEEAQPGYVLLGVDGNSGPLVISTVGRRSFAACSWQRLAP